MQLQQAQQRLASLQAASGTAGNQAAGAQARLRASVRCLEQLHNIFKSALEATATNAPVDLQVGLLGQKHCLLSVSPVCVVTGSSSVAGMVTHATTHCNRRLLTSGAQHHIA